MSDMTLAEIGDLIEQLCEPLDWAHFVNEDHCNDYAEFHGLVATALVQLLNAQKWREIDDEARNGKPWLLYRDGEQFIGKWYPNSKEFGISAPVTEGEVRVWQSIGPRTFAEIVVFEGPTHYAPLPSPPQEKENGDV